MVHQENWVRLDGRNTPRPRWGIWSEHCIPIIPCSSEKKSSFSELFGAFAWSGKFCSCLQGNVCASPHKFWSRLFAHSIRVEFQFGAGKRPFLHLWLSNSKSSVSYRNTRVQFQTKVNILNALVKKEYLASLETWPLKRQLKKGRASHPENEHNQKHESISDFLRSFLLFHLDCSRYVSNGKAWKR